MRKGDAKKENRPFAVTFYTLDVKKKTGGERKDLSRCRIVPQSHNMRDNDTIGIRSEGAAHDYAVHVRLITHVNGHRIKW